MALLTAIVRKEALLPELTAAFAATQLLPVIQAATDRHLAAMRGQRLCLGLCRELLVSSTTWLSMLRLHACVSCMLGHAAMQTTPHGLYASRMRVLHMGACLEK